MKEENVISRIREHKGLLKAVHDKEEEERVRIGLVYRPYIENYIYRNIATTEDKRIDRRDLIKHLIGCTKMPTNLLLLQKRHDLITSVVNEYIKDNKTKFEKTNLITFTHEYN